ncbi:transcriptional regulator [Gnomoniopsis sp. IMI 355080]|nr:transcriptional regulator [Gnomoniopsis sp. IMI 355080]
MKLDLTSDSDFPSLNNNPQMTGAPANQASMWGGQAARNLGGPQRNPSASIPPPSQQDDPFSPSSRLSSSQNSFRFGSQASMGQSQQPQATGGEEFPPLARNGNGEIGQERNASLVSAMGGMSFGSQGGAGSASTQGGRSGNGLLNAVTAQARTTEARSPVGTRLSEGMSSLADDEARRGSVFREDGSSFAQPSITDATGPTSDMRNSVGAIGNDGTASKAGDVPAEGSASAAPEDPLAGMSEADKWGIKGLLALMGKYPTYSALVHGMDTRDFHLDLDSQERISEQQFSLFHHAPPRPAQPNYTLPECYTVRNTQPIEQKVTSFTEETLIYMFYANPQDRHQYLAAQELYNRNWRWHKTLRCWLTKDPEMQPVLIAPETERGYYVVWNANTWERQRRELVLVYSDLESLPQQNGGAPRT